MVLSAWEPECDAMWDNHNGQQPCKRRDDSEPNKYAVKDASDSAGRAMRLRRSSNIERIWRFGMGIDDAPLH
jgi:hypothetical protein